MAALPTKMAVAMDCTLNHSHSTLAIFLATRYQANGSEVRALLRRYGRPGNFVIFSSLPDFAKILHSTGPPLPRLQGFYSQMAKVQSHRSLKNKMRSPCGRQLSCPSRSRAFGLGPLT